jgi:hypothetical protein
MNPATAHEIEESEIFLALVTESYMEEGQHKDEIAYAKALGKPFALAIEKGIDPGSLFDGCNVIGRIAFDRDNLGDEQIGDWLKGLCDLLNKGTKQ